MSTRENWQDGHISIFVYSDKWSPGYISDFLGINPTESIEKGTLISRRLNTFAPRNGWFYQLEFKELNQTDETIQQILFLYLKNKEKFDSLTDVEIRLNCYINSDLAQIGFSISPETAKILAEVGREMEFFIFSWGGVVDDSNDE